MAAATGVSVEEYLHKDYEPDCDYVDGQLEERNVGEYDHGYVQGEIYALFRALRNTIGAYAVPEQRLRVSNTRFRVPDVCVTLGKPKEQVFTKPPFLCVEILSPEDRASRMQSRMQRKIRDYFEFGVKYGWVIDPQERRGWIHTSSESHEAVDGVLRTSEPEITIRLLDVLPDHE